MLRPIKTLTVYTHVTRLVTCWLARKLRNLRGLITGSRLFMSPSKATQMIANITKLISCLPNIILNVGNFNYEACLGCASDHRKLSVFDDERSFFMIHKLKYA